MHPAVAVADTRTKEEFRISDPRTNDRIRVPEVRLVGPNGEQVGVVRIEVALRLAQEADLDLVEVAPNSKPPVVKIMDYGKFKYEAAQKAKEARRNQANTVLKEVRFRLKIEAHDYTTKLKRAEGFLQAGDKVKAMILFRGREQSRPEQGVRLLRKFAEDVAEFGTVESNPTIDGRNMVMVVAPHKNKSEVKTEQNAQRAANKEAARSAAHGGPVDRDETGRRRTRRIGPTDSRPAGNTTTARAGRHTKEEEMPKQKTHSGAKKRFKVTGSGKLMKQQAGMRHNLEGKSSRRTRRLNQDQVLSKGDAKVARSSSAADAPTHE